MKRMLALVGEAYGGPGGIAQYNRDFFDALAAQGEWRIRILPRGGQGEPSPPEHVTQATPIFDRRRFAASAVAAAMGERPEVVFCGHLFMAPLAHLLARLTGAKLIVQLHGIEIWRAPSPATRKALAAADLVLCVSRDTRARLLGWCGLIPERVVVLANTVRDAFTPGERAAARARFGLAGEKVILSVGRLDSREAYKGQDRIIAALRDLGRSGLDPLYLVAGDGDDLPRLRSLAEAERVAERVHFLGRIADADLPDLYRAADLFALPSTGEGFGIVYLEAMACGASALGLNAGGAPDALGDGELGIIAEEADLAQAIAAALRAPPRAELPDEVRRRFGPAAFRERLALIMTILSEPMRAAA